MSIKEAVVWFNQHYDESRKTGDTKNNFYCGITCDLERRANEHNASFICHIKCDTFDTAQELEKQLHAQGYDTGDKVGNGQENSIYVYMYRKIKGVTIE